MLLILPHKHYPFPWIVPHTRLPQLVLFSCLEFDCPAEEVVKTHKGKPPNSDSINACLLFIYPHRGPFSPRIWDHLSVSYWPDTSSFWQCYWYQPILIRYFKSVLILRFISRLGCLKIIGLKRDQTHANIFIRILHFFKCLSQWEHRCSL